MNVDGYLKRREGIGSLFFEIDKDDYQFRRIGLEFEYGLFYTGRQAFKYILDTIQETKTIEKLWVPNYYCQHVTRWIKHVYSNISFYDIDPFAFDNAIDILSFASTKDVVLINNYWGLCDTIYKTSEFPIIVEDHSHGWLTKSCLHSNADYCFASLRKSLPIPLGGIAWKPNSRFEKASLEFEADESFYETFDKLHEAMKIKTLYKQGATSESKETFLNVINETEDYLDRHFEIIKLRNQDYKLLSNYLNIDFLSCKLINLDFLSHHLHDVSFMRIIHRNGFIPFGLILLFKNVELWSSLRSYLIERDIYPSYLWPDNKKLSDWNYLLNVHVDFRYDKQDMLYVAETINEWTTLYKNLG